MALAQEHMVAGPDAVIVGLLGVPVIVVMTVVMIMMVGVTVMIVVMGMIMGMPMRMIMTVQGIVVRHGRQSSVLPV
jgi:hypothetical protein